MKIGILGTGQVAALLGARWAGAGHTATPGAVSLRLVEDIGWSAESIVDLGGIASARGAEHYFLLFAALMRSLRTPYFNIRLVK